MQNYLWCFPFIFYSCLISAWLNINSYTFLVDVLVTSIVQLKLCKYSHGMIIFRKKIQMTPLSCFDLCNADDWTQSRIHLMNVLHHWSRYLYRHSSAVSSQVFLSGSRDGDSWVFRLAHWPWALSMQSAQINVFYRYSWHHQWMWHGV